jgi:hypothetical protein
MPEITPQNAGFLRRPPSLVSLFHLISLSHQHPSQSVRFASVPKLPKTSQILPNFPPSPPSLIPTPPLTRLPSKSHKLYYGETTRVTDDRVRNRQQCQSLRNSLGRLLPRPSPPTTNLPDLMDDGPTPPRAPRKMSKSLTWS